MNNDGILIWSPGMSLEIVEKLVIIKAYSHFRQNKTATANSLGIAIRTLDAKLDKYEFERMEEEKKNNLEKQKKEDLLARARGNPPNNLGIPFSPSSIHVPSSIHAKVAAPAPQAIQNSDTHKSKKSPKQTDKD